MPTLRTAAVHHESAFTFRFHLDAEGHPARPAARAAHREQDALLFFLADVGLVQDRGGLLLKQVVLRQIAGEDLPGRGALARPLRGLACGRPAAHGGLSLHPVIMPSYWSASPHLPPTPSRHRPPSRTPCAPSRRRTGCR